MSFEIDRADMKLLVECGYSSVMRGIDADPATIFHAIDTWMPEYAAGPIGMALITIAAGEFAEADRMLTEIMASDREGRNEANALLAMCKVLQDEKAEAERIAQDLEGSGGHAEEFTSVLVYGVDEESPEDGQVILSMGDPASRGVGQQG